MKGNRETNANKKNFFFMNNLLILLMDITGNKKSVPPNKLSKSFIYVY